MQLDLFQDNRRTILLNSAEEHLRNLELEQAVGHYGEMLAETPDDLSISAVKTAVEAWQRRLERFHSSPPGIDRIYHLYQSITESIPTALLAGLRTFIIMQLEAEESPELIFIPPRFHLGCLLLEIRTPVEAEKWFARALDSAIPARGRFLAWRGDALVMAGETSDAREYYLAAFLEDPSGVDVSRLRDQAVREMLIEMEEEGIDEDETIFWAPAWGWLKGMFGLGTLERERIESLYVEFQTTGDASAVFALPRLWFEFLRHAERLRTEFRNDGELVRVRRKMKELNPILFAKYMEKIKG
jgi:tetratricopeptide (TPR) repeat protein